MSSPDRKRVWLSLSAAAAFVDVPSETIARLSIPWQENPVAHRIRSTLLLLDPGSKGELRYFADDVESLLSGAGIEEAHRWENRQEGHEAYKRCPLGTFV